MSVVGTTVNQAKLDRLTAAAQGGKQGLDEYDANQRSIGSERAQMAAGLASDAASAGYHGPAIGGAPSVLSGQLGAGLNPYQTALGNDRTSFQQQLGSGLAANLRYLDAVKAAEAPTLAAAAAKGGSGGGRGGSSGTPKPLTNSEYTKLLLNAAASVRSQQVQSIQQAEQTAATGEKIAAHNAAGNPTGPALPAGVRLDFPATQRTAGNGPQLGNGPSEPNPELAAVLAARTATIAKSKFDSGKAATAAANVLKARLADQLRVSGSSILPLANEIGTQAGIDPGKLSYLLTPSAEETYRNAIKSGLPPLTAAKAAKPAPADTAAAAKQLGLSPSELQQALGATYVRPGYKPSGTGYASDTGGVAHASAAVGNLVNDIIGQARTAASQGFDYRSWLYRLDQYLAPAVVKKYPAAARLGVAIARGYFPQPVAPQETNPYVRYYNRLYPPVSVG